MHRWTLEGGSLHQIEELPKNFKRESEKEKEKEKKIILTILSTIIYYSKKFKEKQKLIQLLLVNARKM